MDNQTKTHRSDTTLLSARRPHWVHCSNYRDSEAPKLQNGTMGSTAVVTTPHSVRDTTKISRTNRINGRM